MIIRLIPLLLQVGALRDEEERVILQFGILNCQCTSCRASSVDQNEK